MIEVNDVKKSYGHVHAVRGVSFAVSPGEVFGLLGPNGAGKTTILRMLTGYHFPDAGSARVNGYDVYTNPISVKSSIGYLPEDAPLYTELNVLEYLRFIAQARNIAPGDQMRRIEWAVDTCGLGSVVYRSIDHLSKGYRQRTGLAQAIIHDPSILILDEPTSGLDPNQILEIRRLIRELGMEKTVILSTHILQEVEAVCGRVLILNNGQVAAEGTTEQIASGMKGEDVFRFTVLGASADAVESAVERIPYFSRLERLVPRGQPGGRDTGEAGGRDTRGPGEHGAGRGKIEVEITLSESRGDSPEGGELIFDWAVSEGYKLSAIEHKRYSLEDIFINLTTTEREVEEREAEEREAEEREP